MAKLIFGCGYLGERVARLWTSQGETVMAVTRSAERSLELARKQLFTIDGDVTSRDTLRKLHDLHYVGSIDTVLFAIGFDRTPGQSIMDVYQCGVRNVLDVLPDDTGRFIYISTTGVYGDAAEDWIDENTPTNPQREGGRASLAAEQVLTAHTLGRNSIILRLAGLYGPGRIPFLDLLRAGQPIPASQHGHLNLIHVDDAAAVVVAAAQLEAFEAGPHIYCVSDGHPVVRREYYCEVAHQIGAPPPTFTKPDPNSPRARRADSDRRIRNDRMLADLNVNLQYPDYRAGLTAILSNSKSTERLPSRPSHS